MKIYFAPMEGITGSLFRRVHHQFFAGVDKYFMPFLSPTQGHAFTRREWQDILPEHNRGINAVPQLLTRRAEDFLWAAGELAAMGYREVNLNLGCPSGTVTAKGKGSGFLADLPELERFLDTVFGAGLGIDLSIKTRIGVRDEGEFGAILALFNRYPVAELTVHPRVQKDFYREPVHPKAFALALEESRNPLCYNGDLVRPADAGALAAAWPAVDRVMIGRGLVGDPALAERIKGGAAAGRDRLRDFHDTLYEGYCQAFGDRRNASLRMKEIWVYLIRLFRDGEKHGKRLKKAADAGSFEDAAAAVFRELELLEDCAGGW